MFRKMLASVLLGIVLVGALTLAYDRPAGGSFLDGVTALVGGTGEHERDHGRSGRHERDDND